MNGGIQKKAINFSFFANSTISENCILLILRHRKKNVFSNAIDVKPVGQICSVDHMVYQLYPMVYSF